MKKFILASLLCLLLAGCGPSFYYGPIQNLPYVPQEESAKIVFIAEEIPFFGFISQVYIPTIDGIEAYSLEPDQYVSFTIAPGEHIVECNTGGFVTHPDSIIRINPQIGETVYLYCTLEMETRFSSNVSRFKITQLPEDQAQALMKNTTRVGAR